jgi:UDP-N-acetylglucosamine 2-epimerase (non-hydrolysing)
MLAPLVRDDRLDGLMAETKQNAVELPDVAERPDLTAVFEQLRLQRADGKKLIGCAIGTRPEGIKMAPLLQQLARRSDAYFPVPVLTGQHPDVLHMLQEDFGILPQGDLGVLNPGQGLNQLTARLLFSAHDLAVQARVFDLHADLWVVQGDTTSALGVALAAFHNRRPVAHLEAGLRTENPFDPFPEEMNRRLITRLASIHFAPTPTARACLIREEVPDHQIAVTGNTAIDALQNMLARRADFSNTPLADLPLSDGRLIVATIHRRESWPDLPVIADALRAVADRFPDVRLVLPVHPNPEVGRVLRSRLETHDRIHLTPPLRYPIFVHLLQQSTLIVTDSGGIQEEAPTLKRPALVLRDCTERAEAIGMGQIKLIGRDPARIIEECSRLLSDGDAYRAMQRGSNPFGDGHAAARIVAALDAWFSGADRLLPPDQAFQPDPV